MNFKLLLQYDGTDFHGWQIQDELRTVQSELSAALALIEGCKVNVHGSGRTDAGVHAEGQVASVVIDREITPAKLQGAINANVGKDLRVIRADGVADDFHARYSARGKTYVYRVVNGPVLSPFWARYAHHDARPFDLNQMTAGAALFVGRHDWTAFSAAKSDAENRVRTISALDIRELEDSRAQSRMIEIKVSADGFLRYMVRAIAGTLMALGRGEITTSEILEAIETGSRPKTAVTAPACGLTLQSVRYPLEYESIDSNGLNDKNDSAL